MTRTCVAAFAFVVLLSAVARGEGEDANLTEPVRKYLEARKLLYGDDLPSAVELFERVVREHEDTDVADDALYWAAFCHARMPDGRPRAVEAWLRLLKRYPLSPWLDESAAALRELARDRAAEILEAAGEGSPPAAVRARLDDGLAALGFVTVIPALDARLRTGDVEAAIGLSRLGASGAAVLEEILGDESAPVAARTAAFRGFARAVRTEKSVPVDRARAVLATAESDPLLVDVRRSVRALAAGLAPAAEEESPADAVRRLRRQVAELGAQVAELERLVKKMARDESGRD